MNWILENKTVVMVVFLIFAVILFVVYRRRYVIYKDLYRQVTQKKKRAEYCRQEFVKLERQFETACKSRTDKTYDLHCSLLLKYKNRQLSQYEAEQIKGRLDRIYSEHKNSISEMQNKYVDHFDKLCSIKKETNVPSEILDEYTERINHIAGQYRYIVYLMKKQSDQYK